MTTNIKTTRIRETLPVTFSPHRCARQGREDSSYGSLLYNGPSGIYRSTPRGELIFVNSTFASILGYESANEAMEHLFPLEKRLYVDPDRREHFKATLDRDGAAYNLEFEAIKKNGEHIWLSFDAKAIRRDQSLRTCFYEGFVRDISCEKARRDAFEKTLRMLRESNRHWEDLAHMLSHDLKEPLRTAICLMQLVRRRHSEQLPPQALEYVDRSIGGLSRMNDMINSLLSLASVSGVNGRERLTLVGSVVEDVRRDLSVDIQRKQALIRCEPLPEITCDPMLVYQVFANLIENALKYCGERRPVVEIRCKPYNEQYFLFEVEDNGIGFDSRFAELIFQPFRRLEGCVSYSGSGMGLAICKKILAVLGGEIWAVSKPKGGSVFCFTLRKTPVALSA